MQIFQAEMLPYFVGECNAMDDSLYDGMNSISGLSSNCFIISFIFTL